MEKVLIVGAGLAGSLAAGAFAAHGPTMVIEAKAKGNAFLGGHRAVMRFRDPKLELYLRCGMQKVNVYKAVYMKGKLSCDPDILANNLYSSKLYGSLGERSLRDLGLVERYLLPPECVPMFNVTYGTRATGLAEDVAGQKALTTDNERMWLYDVCISTIPMPAMMALAGMNADGLEFKTRSVFVATSTLSIPSTVHQTIYFPEYEFNTYRATIEGRQVIIEGIEPYPESNSAEIRSVLEVFGLSYASVGEFHFYEQPMGKMAAIDDDLRRSIIVELSQKHNIYSLGRFAIWKPIRTDEMLEDIERIKKLINVSQTRRRYENQFGQ